MREDRLRADRWPPPGPQSPPQLWVAPHADEHCAALGASRESQTAAKGQCEQAATGRAVVPWRRITLVASLARPEATRSDELEQTSEEKMAWAVSLFSFISSGCLEVPPHPVTLERKILV